MKFDKRSNRLKTLFKGVGLVGTLVLAFSAFMPDMMNIPQSMRPWLFITFIFWFMSYASGMFTL